MKIRNAQPVSPLHKISDEKNVQIGQKVMKEVESYILSNCCYSRMIYTTGIYFSQLTRRRV